MKTMQDQPKFDWETLNDPEEADARAAINPLDLENASHLFVREMVASLEAHVDQLICEALTVADRFVLTEQEERETGTEPTRLRCQVRRTPSNTLEIQWVRRIAFPLKNQTGVKPNSTCYTFKKKAKDGRQVTHMVKSNYIPKRLPYRYSVRDLGNEPKWAKEFVMRCEARNEYLRQRSELLSKIRRLLYQFDRLTTDYYGELVHPSFTEERLPPLAHKVRRVGATSKKDDGEDPI